MPHSANRRTYRIAAILVGVALGLALAELALRIRPAVTSSEGQQELWTAELAPPPTVEGNCRSQESQARLIDLIRPSQHPDLIYELRPEVRTCFHGAEVRSNRQGLRSDGRAVAPKTEASYRILLLGDSHAFGWGVEWEDTLGERLEQLLAPGGGGPPIEVLNGGVPGYNTSQEAAFLDHHGVGLEPDCVLVLFLGNDLGLPNFLLDPEPPPDPRRSRLLALARRVGSDKRIFQTVDGSLTDFVRNQDLDRVPEAYRHMVGFSGYRRALRRIARLARAHGIEVVNVADYDSHGGVKNRRQVLSKLMKSLGIVEVDVEWPTDRTLQLGGGDPHFNAAGQAEYARRLTAGLKAAGACAPRGG